MYNIILSEDFGKTWRIIGSPKTSLAKAKDQLLDELKNKVKQDNVALIVKIHPVKYVVKVEETLCAHCGKPYEYSDNLVIEIEEEEMDG